MNEISLRPMREDDIPRLSEIRPTYQTDSVLKLKKSGSGLALRWQLVETQQKFDRATGYDFDDAVKEVVQERHSRPDDVSQIVAISGERLIGMMEVEIMYWNNTALLWNLMLDMAHRRQGIGKRLWEEAVTFARQAEVRAVMVETQNTNLAACRFYEKMGCELVGFNEAFYENNRVEFALFWAYSLKS